MAQMSDAELMSYLSSTGAIQQGHVPQGSSFQTGANEGYVIDWNKAPGQLEEERAGALTDTYQGFHPSADYMPTIGKANYISDWSGATKAANNGGFMADYGWAPMLLAGLGAGMGFFGDAGFGGASQLSPELVGNDAIETMWKVSESQGGIPFTEAARNLGYATPEALLNSVNPAWAAEAGGMPGSSGMPGNGEGPFSSPINTPLTSSWEQTAAKLFERAGMPGYNNYGATASPFSFGNVKDALSLASPLMSIGSGLYGMTQADQLKKQAMAAAGRSDPWGASGGRGVADAQLQALLKNPGGVASSDPAYALRMQGAQRATAVQGQDSGAMAVAGANASSDWYNQRLAQLSGISGANQNPAAGESLALSGTMGANDLMSKSLASIGYGVTRGANSMPPELEAFLKSKGYI